MRRFLLLFLFLGSGGCGTKHPPENAFHVAGTGEPCYELPKPWEDPPGGMYTNKSNLPICGPHYDLGDHPVYFRLTYDAGVD